MKFKISFLLFLAVFIIQVYGSGSAGSAHPVLKRCPDCKHLNGSLIENCPYTVGWENCVVKSSWVDDTFKAVLLAIIGPIVGLIAMVIFLYMVLNAPEGKKGVDQQVQVAENIREGAIGFMKSQYLIITLFTILVAILIVAGLEAPEDSFAGHSAGTISGSPYWVMMVHFLAGSLLSAASGVGGMHVAFRANVRTTEACKYSLNQGLKVAFKSGCVMGLSVVSYVVLGQAVLFLIFQDPLALSGFGFGASLVALFSRVGGGIFTKAADVGADLVGKVESGLPEDDPRNPGVIADNVGDNVGDVAGLGADLFESYVGATVAAVPLGFHAHGISGVALPFWISGAGIIASIVGIPFVYTSEEAGQAELLAALRRGIIVAAVLVTGASAGICYFIFDLDQTSGWQLFACIEVGLFSGMIVGNFTEYTTSDAYYPTRSIATRGARTGPATVIIRGFGLGMISTIIPGLVLAGAALICSELQGPYGVAIAAIGMLSTLGITLATDAYGPVADNAGGIAEMSSDVSDEVRERTDLLDALGNTTAATGKGFAIGSALLITLALIATFTTETGISIDMTDRLALAGSIVGALLPFLFAALTMYAVGSSAEELIIEVRRQFRENPDLLKDPESFADGEQPQADYKGCVEICTYAALREMILPGIIAVMAPIAFGFTFGSKFLGGILIGSILSGFFLGISMANAGGAWDNAKKYVERGEVVEKGIVKKKGTEWHAAVVVGDTVGDPFKDTSGPALNILSKLMSHLSLIISGAVGAEFETWETGVIIWAIMAVFFFLGYVFVHWRKPVEVTLTMKGVNWEEENLDDPKTRLALQTNLLKYLGQIAGAPQERFKLGELYKLWGDVEVTFKIIAKGTTTNQVALYQSLLSGQSKLKTELQNSVKLTELELTNKERTAEEAEKLVPAGHQHGESKDHDVVIHDQGEKKDENQALLEPEVRS